MDIWSIIQMVVGGGFVAGVVELGTWLRNRKADKLKAEAEAAQASATAKTSDIEAQRQEIDLMKYMRETMAEWMTQTEEGNKKNFANQDKIMEQLTRMDERLDRQDELLESLQIEVNNQKIFLDGPHIINGWQNGKKQNKQTDMEMQLLNKFKCFMAQSHRWAHFLGGLLCAAYGSYT